MSATSDSTSLSVEAIESGASTAIVESNAGHAQAVADAAAAAVASGIGIDATAHQSSNPWKNEQIEMLVAQGRLRRATMRDYEDWIAAGGVAPRRPVIEDPFESGTDGRFLLQVYVVQAPIRIPEPLYGAHAVTFIVPPGVPDRSARRDTPKSST